VCLRFVLLLAVQIPAWLRLARRPPAWKDADLWGFITPPLVLTWALCGSLVFVDEVAEDGPTLDPRLGEIGHRVVGPGRVE
jgi:hypothetical protein